MTRTRGYTLLELLIVMTLFATITAAAVPNLFAFIAEQRAVAVANHLVATVRLARSVAESRREKVTLCPGTGRDTCDATFDEGWTVFVDRNDDHVLDPGEDVVAMQGALTPVRAFSNRDWFRFRPAGRNSNGTIVFCAGSDGRQARAVVIAPVGRPRVLRRGLDGKLLDCTV